MPGNLDKDGPSLEQVLQGALELNAWQAELLRAAMRQARELAGKGRTRPGITGTSARSKSGRGPTRASS